MRRRLGFVLAAACLVAAVTATAAVAVTGAVKPKVVVAANDFKLTAAPLSRSVVQGKSGSFGIVIRPGAGFTANVKLTVISGLPAGATATFTVNPAPPSTTVPPAATSKLTIAVPKTAALGSYTITIQGTSGSLSHTTTNTLVVTAMVPNFTIHASPASRSVIHGKNGSYGVTIRPVNGFAGQVTLSVGGLPAGATGSFSPNPAPPSTTVPATATAHLAVSTGTAAPGSYTLTITGANGSLSHTATVTLVIT